MPTRVPEVQCAACRKRIHEENMDHHDGIAHCASCYAAFLCPELLGDRRQEVAERRAGVRDLRGLGLEESADRLSFRQEWHPGWTGYAGSLFFMMGLSGFLALIAFILAADLSPFALLAVPLAAYCARGLYFVLISPWQATRVEVRAGRLRVTSGPFFAGGRLDASAAEITGLYWYTPPKACGTFARYALYAVTRGRKEVLLLWDLPNSWSQIVAQKIEDRLRR